MPAIISGLVILYPTAIIRRVAIAALDEAQTHRLWDCSGVQIFEKAAITESPTDLR